MNTRLGTEWIAASVALFVAACGGAEATTYHDAGKPPGEAGLDDATIDAGGEDAESDATTVDDGGEDATACAAPQVLCNGVCTNIDSDRNHCGMCSVQCGDGTVCTGGRCAATCGALATCPSGDGGPSYCANTITDNANCGGCGETCVAGTVCSNGTCALTCGALTTCSPDAGTPYCANTATDNANCGTCGHICQAGTVCSNGTCSPTCGSNLVQCGVACVDGKNDPTHCGASGDCTGANAGVQCDNGKSCVAGSCVCSGGKSTCGAACVDTASDAKNCGGCGNVCQGTCVNGGCATSCANLRALNKNTPSGAYMIDPDGIGPGGAYKAYCDMTNDGGGWTLALKADGASASSNFLYGGALWTNATTLNAGTVDLSRSEAKYASFSQIVASSVRLVIADTSANANNPPTHAQVITLGSPSTLLGLVSGNFTSTAIGRGAWITLGNGGAPQLNCNVEGFNAYFAPPSSRARIGLLGNSQNNCNTPDSAIGFGISVGPGNTCYTKSPSYAVGVIGGGTCAAGGADRTYFGYVYVR
jgi:hypothetical protein